MLISETVIVEKEEGADRAGTTGSKGEGEA
jgi:hypothetical protein